MWHTPACYTKPTVLYEHFMHWCLQKTTHQHIRLKQSNPDQLLTSCICKRKATSDPLNHPQSETLLSHGNVSSSLCAAVLPLPLHLPRRPTVQCVLFVGKPVTGCQVVCDWLSWGPPLPRLLFLVHMHEIAGWCVPVQPDRKREGEKQERDIGEG